MTLTSAEVTRPARATARAPADSPSRLPPFGRRDGSTNFGAACRLDLSERSDDVRSDRHVQIRDASDSAVPAFGSDSVWLVPALGRLIPYDRQIPGSPGYGAQRLIHALASVHSDARDTRAGTLGRCGSTPKLVSRRARTSPYLRASALRPTGPSGQQRLGRYADAPSDADESLHFFRPPALASDSTS